LALLPTEKRKPKQRLEDFSILLYGQPKIGKSTFCSQMDNPLFLATEPGLNALEVYEVQIPDWKTFLQVCAEIAQGGHPFKTIVIDTVDNLWKACAEHFREKLDIVHESDLPYGKAYMLIRDEFLRVLRKMSLLPYGLILTSHVEVEEIKTRTQTINKAVPSIPKSGRTTVLGWVDMILYATMETTEDGEEIRVIRTKPSENWEAGDRTKRLPATVPLDFEEFKRAFYGHHNNVVDLNQAKSN